MGVLARFRGCPALAGFVAESRTGARSVWTSARKAPPHTACASGDETVRHPVGTVELDV